MIRSSITSCGTGRTPPAQLLWGILLAPVTGPRNTVFYSVWNFVIGGRIPACVCAGRWEARCSVRPSRRSRRRARRISACCGSHQIFVSDQLALRGVGGHLGLAPCRSIGSTFAKHRIHRSCPRRNYAAPRHTGRPVSIAGMGPGLRREDKEISGHLGRAA
jgi:hypothetical protein